ncbi:MAG: endonuclease III [Holosporaceae bacterium]|jgi:endonuclease-3|nr:endonuclease III [Holosporaceae bacterium]
MNRIEEICQRLSRSFPDAKTELNYVSDYMFLVSVVLSAQSTDVQVNKVTAKLFQKCRTVDDMLALGLNNLLEEIKSIGLYRRKAENIMALSHILKEKYDGFVPRNREDLEKLPGVGRKTANVIRNILFDEPAIAVDTHVLRLSGRLGLSGEKNPLKVEMDLEKIIPDAHKKNISNMLVLHGRYVCKAQKPDCSHCNLRDLCEWKEALPEGLERRV